MPVRDRETLPAEAPAGDLPASRNILLTGATGVLGAHLMKELLRTTDSTLYCLVRADTPDLAKQRLHTFLRVYDPADTLGGEFARRVVPVIGDIVHENLELSPEKYAELADTIDMTIHSAASTNLFASYRRIAPINVGGTRNIIRFSLKTRRKYLCYVSTYTVMGDKVFDPSLVFKETDLDVGQSFKHLAYQETKFLAENLVRKATNDGLVWNIVRPGQIFGEAETGLYPQGQTSVGGLFYDVFKTIIETGIYPHCQWYCDISPVDYISRSLIQLVLRRNAYFETYHLTNPDLKTYGDILEMVNSLGYPIVGIPRAEYKRLLLEKRLRVNGSEYRSAATKAFKWWFQRGMFDSDETAITDCTYTRRLLEPHGIHCPKVERKLLATYFERAIRQHYFPAPTARSVTAALRAEDPVPAGR